MSDTETRISRLPLVARPGQPSIRTTFQLRADLLEKSGGGGEGLFSAAIATILAWLEKKFPGPLPTPAYEREPFSVDEVPGQTLQCVTVPEQGLWSLRLVQPDAPYRKLPAVPGRTWITEIALARRVDSVKLGIKVLCASLSYATGEIALTRPRIVLHLASDFTVSDIRPLDGKPWLLRTNDDLDELFRLLVNPGRGLPVHLLTQPDEVRLGLRVADFLLDGDRLAREVQGLAHVVLMPSRLTRRWADLVGSSWSVYLGAIRTYRPDLDLDEDSPAGHPLTIAKRVLATEYDGLHAEAAFTRMLVEQDHFFASAKRVDWQPCVFYTDAIRLSSEKAYAGLQEADDWQAVYEQEISSLKAKVTELQAEAEAYNDDAIAAGRVRDYYLGENLRLRAGNDSLRLALEGKIQNPLVKETEPPATYEDLVELINTNLAGRLTLHPRALRGLKDAQYADIDLVWRSLLLLANEYRAMRVGLPDARLRFEENLSKLEVQLQGSITESRAGEQGEAYYIRFPPHSEHKKFLNLHLWKGKSKEQRHSLRIYFFWDDDTQEVVVGWLPSHLDNRLT
jgi:hypothetical protein